MMRVIIAGGTGYVGRNLTTQLLEAGYEVVILSRNPGANLTETQPLLRVVKWDGESSSGWGRLVSGAQIIIHLAGANLGAGRWSLHRKREFILSRVNAGRAIVQALEQAREKPALLIQASGIDYYGVHAEEKIDESWPAGKGFLSDVCEKWENATKIEELGIRRVVYRGAVILGKRSNAFDRLLLPFRFFVGGPLGTGSQWFSWIHLDDQIRALMWVINNPHAEGVYNFCAPQPIQNRELAKVIGKAMKRPAFLAVPAFVIRFLLGEMAVMVLGGQRAVPARLENEGFVFKYPTIESAVQNLIG
jgi:uncharacterized protein